MICLGMANHDIAHKLEISVKTYDTHRGHALTKLNVANVAQLVLLAVRSGFVRLDDPAIRLPAVNLTS